MQKFSFILILVFSFSLRILALGPKPIVLRGDTVTLNDEFTRTDVGYTPGKEMPEISGISCSHVTPGYLWMESDDKSVVVATSEKGEIFRKVKLTNRPSRADWEGISTGMYRDTPTVFVGAFGDNNLEYKDNYYIIYFNEPTIPSTRVDTTIKAHYIHYGYPDGKAHNTEAVMYDNIDQMLYIVDKVGNSYCSVFSLRMDTVYPENELQRLTKVCDLGIAGEWQFQLVTAADISWDGRWILIKNYDTVHEKAYVLMWQRYLGESVGEALQRVPEQVSAYRIEWQGEAIAWLDSTTFYTTSDDDGEAGAPIYKYVRWQTTGLEDISAFVPAAQGGVCKYFHRGHLYIRRDDILYTPLGSRLH